MANKMELEMVERFTASGCRLTLLPRGPLAQGWGA